LKNAIPVAHHHRNCFRRLSAPDGRA
jgi:hypothetical protein